MVNQDAQDSFKYLFPFYRMDIKNFKSIINSIGLNNEPTGVFGTTFISI